MHTFILEFDENVFFCLSERFAESGHRDIEKRIKKTCNLLKQKMISQQNGKHCNLGPWGGGGGGGWGAGGYDCLTICFLLFNSLVNCLYRPVIW